MSTYNHNTFRSPIAEQMWDLKYRMKDYEGNPIDITVQDTWARIADSLASVEENYFTYGEDGLIDYDRRMHWEEEFYRALGHVSLTVWPQLRNPPQGGQTVSTKRWRALSSFQRDVSTLGQAQGTVTSPCLTVSSWAPSLIVL